MKMKNKFVVQVLKEAVYPMACVATVFLLVLAWEERSRFLGVIYFWVSFISTGIALKGLDRP